MKLNITIDPNAPTKSKKDYPNLPSCLELYQATIEDGIHEPVSLYITGVIGESHFIFVEEINRMAMSISLDGKLTLWCSGDEIKTVDWSPENHHSMIEELLANMFVVGEKNVIYKSTVFGTEEVVVEWLVTKHGDVGPLMVDGKLVADKYFRSDVSRYIFSVDGIKDYIYYKFPNQYYIASKRSRYTKK